MTAKIYQAGPLFTEAERRWHHGLKDQLESAGFYVTWPGSLFDAQELSDMGHKAKEHIFQICKEKLERSDLIVALLDGTQVDDGTAWEIGYAFSRGIPIVGIRTDFRNAGDTEHSLVNAMIECSCVIIVSTVDELIEKVRSL